MDVRTSVRNVVVIYLSIIPELTILLNKKTILLNKLTTYNLIHYNHEKKSVFP